MPEPRRADLSPRRGAARFAVEIAEAHRRRRRSLGDRRRCAGRAVEPHGHHSDLIRASVLEGRGCARRWCQSLSTPSRRTAGRAVERARAAICRRHAAGVVAGGTRRRGARRTEDLVPLQRGGVAARRPRHQQALVGADRLHVRRGAGPGASQCEGECRLTLQSHVALAEPSPRGESRSSKCSCRQPRC